MSQNIKIVITPHSKKIGETYIFPRMLDVWETNESQLVLFNVVGEWDHLDTECVIANPMRWFAELAPNIENFSPWLNYRIWLTFTSLSIIFGLPIILWRITALHNNITVIARMATLSVIISRFWSPRKVRFCASMAGVPLANIGRKLLWRIFYTSYDTIYIPCETMRNHLIRLLKTYPDRKIKVLRNAVLTAEHFRHTHTVRSIADKLKIYTVGRLTRQKGVDVLIKACAKLEFDFELHVFGDGELHDGLLAMSEKLLPKNSAFFHGRVENVWSKTSELHLFVMPSRWEGPGHTIIEALACGIPSIVSNCPYGPEETVEFGRYGFVFQADNVEQLEMCINRAYDDYELILEKAKLGKIGMQKFVNTSVVQEWYDV